jgi:HEPN domain-containing protein
VDILDQLDITDVPDELFRLSDAYLGAADNLNRQLNSGSWPSSYQRGQVVLFLALHAIELHLKGCLKTLQPSYKAGHSIAKLVSDLRNLQPSIEFDPPFGSEPLAIELEGETSQMNWDKVANQVFRYPMDREGAPWEALFAFSADIFQGSLDQLHCDFESMRYQVKRNDG